MAGGKNEEEVNWSEQVEDLIESGDVEKAISVLESQVSKLDTQSSSSSTQLRLSSALTDLAQLYSAKGFSLKADQARSRARTLKIAISSSQSSPASCKASASDGWSQDDGNSEKSSNLAKSALPGDESPDDGWEAMADRCPEDLLSSSQCLSEVSKPSVEEKVNKFNTSKCRGRGTFSYTSHGLNSNEQSNDPVIEQANCPITDDLESNAVDHGFERDTPKKNVSYGTRHILVLADIPPSTTTIELEKHLKNFKDRGLAIRWVNDTVALAVFKSPTVALEVCSQIQCPFTVRVLDQNDALLSSIPPRDLEPPRQRPKTSARAATRLIAQGMGIKLPTANFGSTELRKQEEARRNRIVSRQNMRDDAWGDDVI